ncbi:MAG: hypothetical protein Q8R37_01950 [Nanoarchaeota archaeon]|nr:hypothetical protein [Nanoarchaeota archaeon]
MAVIVERQCVEIEKSLQLAGFVSSTPWLNCDVTIPLEINNRKGHYALLSQGMRFGFTELGYIDFTTREFKLFESPKDRKGLRLETTLFEMKDMTQKTKMYVPLNQLQYLKTLEEILSIPGISLKAYSQ